MWNEGAHLRITPRRPIYGIYSIKGRPKACDVLNSSSEFDIKENKSTDNVARILQKVDTMKLDDQEDENQNERVSRRSITPTEEVFKILHSSVLRTCNLMQLKNDQLMYQVKKVG